MSRNIIQKNNARRYAIADIHGCLNTFRTLLREKIDLRKEDQLFLLGDYVHRGPDSEGVLNEIRNLILQDYQIYPIRGNHEDKYLKERSGKIDQKYKQLLDSMPYYYETEDFIFVHAGLNFSIENPFEDTNTMKWGLGFKMEPEQKILKGRSIVHGHTITSLSDIFDAVMDRAIYIPIDNGCYRALEQEEVAYGTLVALDLDNMKMIVQENIDKKE